MNQAATGRAQRQTVIITVQNGQIQVSQDTFRISKSNQEEVVWQAADPNLYFTVEFNESPFYESQFSSEYPASGLVRRSVLPDPQKNYEYTIRAGGAKLDPGGVITK